MRALSWPPSSLGQRLTNVSWPSTLPWSTTIGTDVNLNKGGCFAGHAGQHLLVATIGNTAKPTSGMVMTSLNNQNQVALKVTMPARRARSTGSGSGCAGNGVTRHHEGLRLESCGNLLAESV